MKNRVHIQTMYNSYKDSISTTNKVNRFYLELRARYIFRFNNIDLFWPKLNTSWKNDINHTFTCILNFFWKLIFITFYIYITLNFITSLSNRTQSMNYKLPFWLGWPIRHLNDAKINTKSWNNVSQLFRGQGLIGQKRTMSDGDRISFIKELFKQDACFRPSTAVQARNSIVSLKATFISMLAIIIHVNLLTSSGA